jgi:hypothetical protein
MSGVIWLPQWRRVNLGGPTGAPYAHETSIKIVWHRWQGNSWAAAESAFAPYPPHCAAKIGDHVRQYVPLDEHSYALAGSASEAEFVIQVEVSGFSEDSRNMSDADKEWIAHEVLEPILFFHDVPDVHPLFYDQLSGFTIASATSPIRFKFADWAVFSGHVGHQHAPSPDEHWDPGLLDIDTIVRIARTNTNGQPQGEVMKGTYVRRVNNPAVHLLLDSGIIHPVTNFANTEEVFKKVLGVQFVDYTTTETVADAAGTLRKVWVLQAPDADMVGLPK